MRDRPAYVRVAHLLCEQFMRMQAVGLATDNTCPLPLTQTQIGDALGLSNVHVNRTLMELRAAELFVFERSRLTILDWDALKAAGEFDPLYLHLRRMAQLAAETVRGLKSFRRQRGTYITARCLPPMPRFYFDIADGPETGVDAEGLEFPDLGAARAQALATLGEIARDELPDGDRRDFEISIRDESGQILLKASLALRVENTP